MWITQTLSKNENWKLTVKTKKKVTLQVNNEYDQLI